MNELLQFLADCAWLFIRTSIGCAVVCIVVGLFIATIVKPAAELREQARPNGDDNERRD